MTGRDLWLAQRAAQADRQKELREGRAQRITKGTTTPAPHLDHEHDWRLDPQAVVPVENRDNGARRTVCVLCGAVAFVTNEGPTSGGDPEDLQSWVPTEEH